MKFCENFDFLNDNQSDLTTILSCFHPRFLLDAPSTVRTMAEAKFPLLLTLAFCLLHLAHNSPTSLGVFGGFGGYVVNNNIPWLFSQRDTNSDG